MLGGTGTPNLTPRGGRHRWHARAPRAPLPALGAGGPEASARGAARTAGETSRRERSREPPVPPRPAAPRARRRAWTRSQGPGGRGAAGGRAAGRPPSLPTGRASAPGAGTRKMRLFGAFIFKMETNARKLYSIFPVKVIILQRTKQKKNQAAGGEGAAPPRQPRAGGRGPAAGEALAVGRPVCTALMGAA